MQLTRTKDVARVCNVESGDWKRRHVTADWFEIICVWWLGRKEIGKEDKSSVAIRDPNEACDRIAISYRARVA